ncbi:MAG: hypothetical protein ACPG4U_08180, partial [Pseudomonadales bacterium]
TLNLDRSGKRLIRRLSFISDPQQVQTLLTIAQQALNSLDQHLDLQEIDKAREALAANSRAKRSADSVRFRQLIDPVSAQEANTEAPSLAELRAQLLLLRASENTALLVGLEES